MKFDKLNTSKKTARTRVGRGISAGKGKTAGRGTKGQNARTGGGVRLGFEGGQNPLNQRIPKLRGFTSHRPKTFEIKTSQLTLIGKKINNKTLAEKALIPTEFCKVKIIFDTDVDKPYSVELQSVSKGAKTSIEKAKGTVTIVDVPKQTKKTDKKK